MRFDIITLFPEMFSAIKEEGVVARAIKKSMISINEWQLRDFSENKYKNVDDKAYGGGAGMVMQVKPIRDCIKKIKEQEPETKVIYLSPQGEPLNQNLVEKLSSFESLTLLCGRYEGVDERIIKNDVDLEVSIGDKKQNAPTLCARYQGKVIPLNSAHDGRPILMNLENALPNL